MVLKGEDDNGSKPPLRGSNKRSHGDISRQSWENGSTSAQPTEASSEWNTREVRNQIRRTEKEAMEMGTMEWVRFTDHIGWAEGLTGVVAPLTSIGGAYTSATVLIFI